MRRERSGRWGPTRRTTAALRGGGVGVGAGGEEEVRGGVRGWEGGVEVQYRRLVGVRVVDVRAAEGGGG